MQGPVVQGSKAVLSAKCSLLRVLSLFGTGISISHE